jgi:hypothetical protein
MHNHCTQFQVVVGLDMLLHDGLHDTFAVMAFELTGKKVAEPRELPLNNFDDRHKKLTTIAPDGAQFHA